MNAIQEYYKKTGLPDLLIDIKVSAYERNPDIAKEFEYWINTQKYIEDCVIVKGYSAKKISELSEFMDGEGAFSLLIQLRENPQKALNKIADGFKMK